MAVESTHPSQAEAEQVAELLGRQPQTTFQIVVRDKMGAPLVLRNAALQHDGRPMPTMYWLIGKDALRRVSRLESTGGVRTVERLVPAEQIAAAHARYAVERDATIPAQHSGPRPSGGVAGTRQGIKCLHAHYAYHLAGGDDPVGRWVAAQLLETPE